VRGIAVESETARRVLAKLEKITGETSGKSGMHPTKWSKLDDSDPVVVMVLRSAQGNEVGGDWHLSLNSDSR
jgi:hypothetical protein